MYFPTVRLVRRIRLAPLTHVVFDTVVSARC